MGVKRIIVVRHGVYERNNYIDGKHSDAENGIYKEPEHPDYTMDLSSEGQRQIEIARNKLDLAKFAIDVCLYSPFLRTETSAHILCEGLDVPLEPEALLSERNLGRFATMPRAQFHTEYSESYAEKRADPLGWSSNYADVESLNDVNADRITPLLNRLDANFLGGTVLLVAHADVMVAMRAHSRLGAMTNERLKRPLTADLQNPLWVQNAQIDLYDKKKSKQYMQAFRSITTADTQYDTGWLEIKR